MQLLEQRYDDPYTKETPVEDATVRYDPNGPHRHRLYIKVDDHRRLILALTEDELITLVAQGAAAIQRGIIGEAVRGR
jgi:hypothetical protein